MDIVIPLGTGSKWNNNELRYGLRSIQKFIKGDYKVFIVGERPAWLQNVIHIPFKEGRDGTKNICNKVLEACKHPDLSEDFIFTNDDIFLQEPIASDYPFYYDFQLIEKLKNRAFMGSYFRAQVNTMEALKAQGYPTLNYDTHLPIIYNKILFPAAMSLYDWSIPFGYVVKSLYANTVGLKGTHILDCKLNKRRVKDETARIIKKRPAFSIGDGGLNENLKALIHELYPNPSKYELT